MGFEPTVRLPPHALSRRAPLAARTRHREGGYKVDRDEGERRRPPSWSSDDEQKNRAEDRGFEPLRAINPTRFPSERHRPLGESSAGEATHSLAFTVHWLTRSLRADPPCGITSLNPPGPEGSKGRRALVGVRGIPCFIRCRLRLRCARKDARGQSEGSLNGTLSVVSASDSQ